jgi:hypothetical protein
MTDNESPTSRRASLFSERNELLYAMHKKPDWYQRAYWLFLGLTAIAVFWVMRNATTIEIVTIVVFGSLAGGARELWQIGIRNDNRRLKEIDTEILRIDADAKSAELP